MSNSTTSAALSYAYLTDAQYISAVSIGYISCLLSLFGSCSIIYLVSKRPNVWKDKEQLYHRLVFSLSVTDVITTLSLITAPFMNRRDTEVLFAKGNIRTCEASAFLFRFFSGTIFFNAMLSIYFLRTIRYGHAIIFKREYLVYLCGFLFPVAVGLHGLLSQALNPSLPLGICTFTKYPFNCTPGKGDCTRGPEQEFRYWLHSLISILLAVTGIVCTWLVYLTIRKQRLTSQRYSHRGSSTLMNNDERKKIRAVAVQAICYTLDHKALLSFGMLEIIDPTTRISSTLEPASRITSVDPQDYNCGKTAREASRESTMSDTKSPIRLSTVALERRWRNIQGILVTASIIDCDMTGRFISIASFARLCILAIHPLKNKRSISGRLSASEPEQVITTLSEDLPPHFWPSGKAQDNDS